MSLTATLITGCTTTHTPGPSTVGGQASGSVPSAAAAVAGQAAVMGPPVAPDPRSLPSVGLRGTRLTTGLSCRGALRQAWRQWSQDQNAIDDPSVARAPEPAVPGAVTLIRVCPNPRSYDRSAQRDLPAGSELLRVATTALSLADEPAPDVEGPVLCTLEGDAEVVYVGKTRVGTYLLHIPETACSHHIGPVRALEARILP